MKLGILAVGHKLPDWVAAGCNEYIKRMPRELPVVCVDIKPEARGAKGSRSREQLLAAEYVRQQAALQGYKRIVVLDERGIDLTTTKLAQHLESWMREGGDTAFVIGGADGIDETDATSFSQPALAERPTVEAPDTTTTTTVTTAAASAMSVRSTSSPATSTTSSRTPTAPPPPCGGVASSTRT